MTGSDSRMVFSLVVLLLMSALFSAIETAYSSASRIRLKNMQSDGNKKAGRVLHVLDDFDRFLSAVLVGNNIVNIASATIGTILFTKIYGSAGATISTAVITIAVLIFGEIMPKSIAKKIPERFSIRTVGLVVFFEAFFFPLTWFFGGIKSILDHLVHVDEDESDIADELITMVDEAEKEGDLEEHESDLISAAIEFNDLDVSDILTPRVDIVAVEASMPLDKVEQTFRMNSFSRLPVYEKSIDSIIGVIHEKDFYNFMYQDRRSEGIRSIIKPVIYTGENVKISTLLKQLQMAKLHLAIVLDEYGGTQGIITMEDIVEELVGEIWDEHDTVKEYYQKIDENTYLVKCDADFEDMMERFGVEPVDDGYEFNTVSGWVVHEREGIPRVGDSFDYENLHVQVTRADQRKAEQIKVTILPKTTEDDKKDD